MMALPTACQTPGAEFTIKITPFRMSVDVALPNPVMLLPSQAEELECHLHNVVELVLAPYFGRH